MDNFSPSTNRNTLTRGSTIFTSVIFFQNKLSKTFLFVSFPSCFWLHFYAFHSSLENISFKFCAWERRDCNVRKFVANLVMVGLTSSLLSVFVDVFCDAFGMLYNVFDSIVVSHILKHEVYAMCNTWSPKYCFVFSL